MARTRRPRRDRPAARSGCGRPGRAAPRPPRWPASPPTSSWRRLVLLAGWGCRCRPLQFEAILAPTRDSTNPNDFAVVCLLGLLGLRIFEATSLDITDLGEEHGHRVRRVIGKGHKIVPMPPAVTRAVERAIGHRVGGPILLNRRGARMDRHAATRRLRHLQAVAGVQITRKHPHMLRRTFATTMLDAGLDLRDTQIAARHADPRTTMRYDRARTNLDRRPNYILAAYMSSGT